MTALVNAGVRNLAAFSRGALGFVVAALAWEIFARSGWFPPAVTPPVPEVLRALGQMVLSGALFTHIGTTLARIFTGLALAALVGIPLGLVMGRVRRVEKLVLPIVSVLSPIPSLAHGASSSRSRCSLRSGSASAGSSSARASFSIPT